MRSPFYLLKSTSTLTKGNSKLVLKRFPQGKAMYGQHK